MTTWPPANWTDWPGTRIGALVFNGVLTIFFTWGFCWSEARFKRILRGPTDLFENTIDSQREGVVLSSKTHRLWSIFAVGRDTVAVTKAEGGYKLVLIQERLINFCCYCGVCAAVGGRGCVTTTRRCNVTQQEMKNLGQTAIADPPLCGRAVWSIVLGCAAGLWLHFWPCIWWTCDWGDSDGQGVRGAIWFATWGVVGLFLCCCNTSHTAIQCNVNGHEWVLMADDLCVEALLKTVNSERDESTDIQAFVHRYETAFGKGADSYTRHCGICCCV